MIQKYRGFILIVLLIAVLLTTLNYTGLLSQFNFLTIKKLILDHQLIGLLIFVAMFCAANLIYLPGWIFLVAAVLALGQVTGGIVTYLTACFSCAFTFLLVRGVGGDALRQIRHPFALKLLSQLDRRPIQCIVFLRLFMQSSPPLNYALATSGIKFRQYMTGTMLGLPLPISLYCIFFDYLSKALKVT